MRIIRTPYSSVVVYDSSPRVVLHYNLDSKMLSINEVFNLSAHLKFSMSEEFRKKQTLAEAKDAFKLLVSFGLIAKGSISLETLAGQDSICNLCLPDFYWHTFL